MEMMGFKVGGEDTNIIKKWEKVEIKGEKPEARMGHSFDLLINKVLCVLMGGINQNN